MLRMKDGQMPLGCGSLEVVAEIRDVDCSWDAGLVLISLLAWLLARVPEGSQEGRAEALTVEHTDAACLA